MGNSADTTVRSTIKSDGSVLIERVQQAPYNSDGWWTMQSVLNLYQCKQFDITEIRYKMKVNKFPHRWGIGIVEYDLKNDKTDFSHKAGVDFVDGIAFDTLNVKGKPVEIDAGIYRDKVVGVVLHIATAQLHIFGYQDKTSWKPIWALDLEKNSAYKMIIRLPSQNDGITIQERSIWNKTTRVKNDKLKNLQKTHNQLITKQKEMENMQNILNRTLSKMEQQNQEIKTFMNSISQQQAIVKSIQIQMQNMEDTLNTKLETIANKQSKIKPQNQEVRKLMNCMTKQQDTVEKIQKKLNKLMDQLAAMNGKEDDALKKVKDAEKLIKKNESTMQQIKKMSFVKYAAVFAAIAGIYKYQSVEARLKIAAGCCAGAAVCEYLISKM
eukprot:288937_1